MVRLGIVNRNTRGLAKLVAEREAAACSGVHMLTDGALDELTGDAYLLRCRRSM